LRKHFIEQITQRARVDKRVFLLIGDLGYSVVEDFGREFPSRFANVGVSEQAGMGIAAGLAKSHLPIFYSIANFPSFRCLEQIRNDVAHEGNPVMIVSLGAGFSYGTAGYSHHAIEDAGAVGSIFGMSVFTPACIHELDAVLEDYWKEPRPIYLRLGSAEHCDGCLPGLMGIRNLDNSSEPGSQASTLFVTHGEIGKLVAKSLEPCDIPYRHLSIADFNLSSRPVLDFVASFKKVVTVEEHSKEFGFGARLRTKLSSVNFEVFEIMGVPELDFHVGGKRQFHLERAGLSEISFLNELERVHNA
jgi:transketolase